ncbi:sensor histidine kinase [Paenibacillus filicis]|uniref:Sensor histidine kinase n=1 Tax=Paenibacillus gyeongsangnamensis TaxID=3388067 RepID=A0ABT4QHT6_9BACL|nr:sensor histidine kinase [Paenibacillus filicis]MCZ8516450.1 sensor histidine kinase [Paenibacillus filicis]
MRLKLILLLLIATIAPIVTSMIVTNMYTKQSVKQKAIVESTNLLNQGKLNLINYMNQLNELTFSVYRNQSFSRLIDLGFTGYESEAEIYNLMQTISLNQDVYQVYLNIFERGPGEPRSFLLLNSRKYPSLSPEITVPTDQWSRKDSYESVVETTHLSHNYNLGPSFYFPPRYVLTIHRQIYRIPSKALIGSLSVDMKTETLNGLLGQLQNEQENIYLLDEQGKLVYSSSLADSLGVKPRDVWVDEILARPENDGTLETKDSIRIFERVETPFMKWTLVKQIPYEQLYRGARELTQIQSVILGALLFVVVALTLWISLRFTRPIKRLIGYINQIQSGQLEVDIQVNSKDEIGILARRFRHMMETINQLIKQEYMLNLANKTNQLKALQAQINPHFLYNSLQSIGTLALQHDAPNIYKLLSSLAKMMRYSMNTDESIVPLRKELEHIKAYLQLQTQRFEDDLSVRYHIDEETLDMLLPKMTLQPIVENYFKYGFDPRSKPDELVIASRLLPQDRMEIIVSDNGRSLSEEELAELNRKLSEGVRPAGDEGEEEGGSIGLLNVRMRLWLYFNEMADLTVQNNEPTGFRVTLHMPFEQRAGGNSIESDHR